MIGYAFCGSFCTLTKSLAVLKKLCEKYEVLPIMSEMVYSSDTRFYKAKDLREQVEEITEKEIVHTIKDAEPLGPALPLDALIISPCTGNTLAKMALGITDTPVTMAAKAHLRSDRPLIIALASNDAMSANLKNINTMLMRKNVYFTPMRQDSPLGKPHSLVADFSLLEETLEKGKEKEQLRPLFL